MSLSIYFADTRLYFVNDTPRVDLNSVTAEFEVGSSFNSVRCSVNSRSIEPVDCKYYENASYYHLF